MANTSLQPATTCSVSALLLILAVEVDFVQGFCQPLSTLTTQRRFQHATRQHHLLHVGIHMASSFLPTVRNTVQPRPHGKKEIRAWPNNRDPKGMPPDYPLAVARIAITIMATLLTWYAHAYQRCGPVIASASVTLISSLIAPGLGQAAMTGTFAGMSGVGILPSWQFALVAGTLTSFLFECFIHYWNIVLGMGGRLGFLAFIAVNAVAKFQGIPVVFPAAAPSAALKSSLLAPMIFGAIGSAFTIALRESSDDKAAADPIRASALVGLLAGILVGVHPAYTDFGALCVYLGSFTGMSLPSRLLYGIIPGKKPPTYDNQPILNVKLQPPVLVAAYAVAGAIGGLVFGITLAWDFWTVPAGWGGKLGTSALMGVLISRGLCKLFRVEGKSSGTLTLKRFSRG